MDLKSDIGAKAAWKGFSSQTVYIAYRLMILEEKFDIYPENVEDLMTTIADSHDDICRFNFVTFKT